MPGLRCRDWDWSRSELTVLAGVWVGAGVGLTDSDSGTETKVNTRQPMILDERLCTLPKTLKDEKKRSGSV